MLNPWLADVHVYYSRSCKRLRLHANYSRMLYYISYRCCGNIIVRTLYLEATKKKLQTATSLDPFHSSKHSLLMAEALARGPGDLY